MPIWFYIGLGSLLAGALGGWTVRDWKADSDALEAVHDAQEHEDAARAAIWQKSDQREAQREASEQRRRDTSETIREYYRNAPPVPANCAAPDLVVGLHQRNIEAANAEARGQSGPPLSGSSDAADAPDR